MCGSFKDRDQENSKLPKKLSHLSYKSIQISFEAFRMPCEPFNPHTNHAMQVAETGLYKYLALDFKEENHMKENRNLDWTVLVIIELRRGYL